MKLSKTGLIIPTPPPPPRKRIYETRETSVTEMRSADLYLHMMISFYKFSIPLNCLYFSVLRLICA